MSDYTQAISFIEAVGNGSHDARNLLAMKKRLEFPELQVIDTAVAVIEGQAREIITIFVKDSANALMRVKPLMRSVYRNLQFLVTSMDNFKNLDYEILIDEDFKELYENLVNQRDLVLKVDSQLNQLFCSFLKPQKQVLDEKTPGGEEQTIKNFVQAMDFSLQPNYKGKEGSFESLIQYTKDICNRAHHIQTKVCPLQAVEAVKAQANGIINYAGQIENQTRAMLTNYDVHKNNPDHIKKVIGNQKKAMCEQIGKIQNDIQILNKGADYQEISRYLEIVLNWVVESTKVYESVQKNEQGKLVCVF